MTRRASFEEGTRSTRAIADWISDYIATRLGIETSSMALDAPFSDFGIDSAFAVVMSGDIAHWIGHDVPPNLLYEYPTVNALARHIASLG
jgi:acyl carrier protein